MHEANRPDPAAGWPYGEILSMRISQYFLWYFMNIVTSERRTKKGGTLWELQNQSIQFFQNMNSPLLVKIARCCTWRMHWPLETWHVVLAPRAGIRNQINVSSGTPKRKVSFICESLTQKIRLQIFKKKCTQSSWQDGKLRLRTQHVADPNHGTYRGASLDWWQQTMEMPKWKQHKTTKRVLERLQALSSQH